MRHLTSPQKVDLNLEMSSLFWAFLLYSCDCISTVFSTSPLFLEVHDEKKNKKTLRPPLIVFLTPGHNSLHYNTILLLLYLIIYFIHKVNKH